MTTPHPALIFFMLLGSVMARSEDLWTQPRDISQFQFLMDRSPFSLPTAEESSPLADRYTLTGAASLNGEPLIFVLDKNTQEHHMLSKSSNNLNIGLVEYLPDPDPRHMRATIKVNGQTATISYAEPVSVQGQQPQAASRPAANPNPNPTVVVNAPPAPVAAPVSSPNMRQPNSQPPDKRVLRRRIISGQTSTSP